MLKKIMIASLYIFLIPLYLFSMIVPRNKKLWVFGAWFGKRYSDSSRYVFEYVTSNEKDIRAIWLTKEQRVINELTVKGLEVYHINSIKGYWYTCRAAVAIFCVNISEVNRLGASRIFKYQLWHGIPLKKIVYDDQYEYEKIISTRFKGLKRLKGGILPFLEVYGKWDAVSSTSPYVSRIFSSAFDLDLNNVYLTGSPRADVILHEDPVKPAFIRDRGKFKHIGYFPTHRQDTRLLQEFLRWEKLENLSKFLQRQNSILYIKLHYYNLTSLGEIRELSNIVFLKEEDAPDINYILPWIDILITDYSSVFYDYLLLDRPMIFAPFDLAKYVSGERELYGDYNELTPGEKCYSWEEVVQVLQKLFNGEDGYIETRSKLKDKYHYYHDTMNSRRVIEFAKKKLNITR